MEEATQGRNYKERNATFPPDYSSLACQSQLSRAFQYPFMLPCRQALSWLEVLTPSHPPAFHTHHMEPYAALALYHLASGWETKILAFQRLNEFPLLFSSGVSVAFSSVEIYVKIVSPMCFQSIFLVLPLQAGFSGRTR